MDASLRCCLLCGLAKSLTAFSPRQQRAAAPRCQECLELHRQRELQLTGVSLDPRSGEPQHAAILGRHSGSSPSAPPSSSAVRRPKLYVSADSALPRGGLQYFPEWLSHEEELAILQVVDSHGWSTIFRRRQQFFGEVYYHTRHEVAEVQPIINGGASGSWAEQQLLSPRQPGVHPMRPHMQPLIRKFYSDPDRRVFGPDESHFPTQVLVNEYVDEMGLGSHFEDEDAFGEVIATISLINPILMTLEKPREHTNTCDDLLARAQLLLEPRSLLVLSGEARRSWRHGISRRRRIPLPDGSMLQRRRLDDKQDAKLLEGRFRRLSLTIRHLLPGRRQCA